MIIKSVSLETVCGTTSVPPKNNMPEFALAGRSNVGKSSLINVLINRRSYARVSSAPGKTQTINFYNVNQELYLVDLPGYGYAKASEKDRREWGRMVERYLKGSSMLRAVFLLVDIRHNPSESDRIMYGFLAAAGYRPIVIATKLDKLKRSQIKRRAALLREGLSLASDIRVIPFSARTKQGREEIWERVEAQISQEEPEK